MMQRHIAILGKTGSGKTVASKGMVERVLTAGGRACIIDPTGVWYGLRLNSNGKNGSGFPVVIFGGPHGDVALSANHGEAIAEIIGTSSTSAVIDTSAMKVSERTRFFTDFGDSLIRKNKGPLHVVIDECHLFMPQGRVSDPMSGQMLHAANNLVSLGRSRGLRITLISQRPAKVHKDSLTQVETLVAMRLIAPQDRNAIEAWIEDNADNDEGLEIIRSLATLKTGEAWIWSPEIGVLDRVKFPKNHTFDSSAADIDGAGPEMPPIDLATVNERLSTIAAETKANDPKALKAEIARLKAEAARGGAKIDESAHKRAIVEAHDEGYEQGRKMGWQAAATQLGRKASEVRFHLAKVASLLHEADQDLNGLLIPPEGEIPFPEPDRQKPVTSPKASEPRQRPSQSKPVTSNGDVPGGSAGQRIIDGLVELQALGVTRAPRVLAAFMANYSNLRSKGFSNAMGALRSSGCIEYPTSETVYLTGTGREFAKRTAVAVSTAEMQARIGKLLGGAADRILDAVIGAHPDAMDREALAATAGYENVRSKGFANAIGRLHTLGFVEYPTRGEVRASDLLFP